MTDLSKEADTLGYAAIVPDCREKLLHNQRIGKVIKRSDTIELRFLHWLMRSQSYRNEVLAGVTGSTVKHTSPSKILAYQFLLPPLIEQGAIASVLDAVDDKIELNQRMNETLEAMARAIFKDWFVDFGPTRAKAEGRAPFLAPDLWSLFPNGLDGNGRPEGWRAGSLLDVCQLKRGYDLPSAQRLPGRYPIISSSGATGFHSTFMAKAPGVVTGRYGTIGEVFFINEPYWPLNTTLYVCDFKGSSYYFVYYTISNLDFRTYSDKGAVPGINRNHLHQAQVVVPPQPIQDAFTQTVAPLWERRNANIAESETLGQLRDLLLPKLMSGEIRVRDAERALETAA
jgi:type I restriction enzyme S subunit